MKRDGAPEGVLKRAGERASGTANTLGESKNRANMDSDSDIREAMWLSETRITTSSKRTAWLLRRLRNGFSEGGQ